jgi:hypothetical protein
MSGTAVQNTDVHEAPRGCSRRQSGGMCLVSGGACVPCGRRPILPDRCPTCRYGRKASRGWTWVDRRTLLEPAPARGTTAVDLSRGLPERDCSVCPLGQSDPQRVGLLTLVRVQAGHARVASHVADPTEWRTTVSAAVQALKSHRGLCHPKVGR